MKLSVVIPLLNEENNIRPLYERLQKAIVPLTSDYELLFIDDGSQDYSLQTLRTLQDTDSHVKVLSFTRNFGHQVALTAGLDHALGDAVIMMDSDLQHPPELVPQLVEAWKQGAEVVYAIRNKNSSTWLLNGVDNLFYKVFP